MISYLPMEYEKDSRGRPLPNIPLPNEIKDVSKQMSIKLYPPEYLFPTKILTSCDGDFNSYRDDMIKWMVDYSNKNETVGKSNLGGYQSPDNFYLEESFAPFMNRISDHIMSTVADYVDDKNIHVDADQLKLCNMWFNFNYKDSYNVTHTHPGCVLAGVLWVQSVEESPHIMFEAYDCFARASLERITHESFEPKEGFICLFPAHMPHRVDINHSEHTRISISFNIVQQT